MITKSAAVSLTYNKQMHIYEAYIFFKCPQNINIYVSNILIFSQCAAVSVYLQQSFHAGSLA